MTYSKTWALAASAATMLAFAGASEAASLSFYNDAGGKDTPRFSITCNGGDCDGLALALISAGGNYDDQDKSGILGQLFDTKNSGDSTELAFVNANLYAGDAALRIEDLKKHEDAAEASFKTNARYIIVKTGKGPNVGLIVNLSNAMLELSYTQTGKGSGLSHYTSFGASEAAPEANPRAGGVSAVPLPPAGLFMLGGLAGFGFITRRRR